MKAADVMTDGVVSVDPDLTVEDVAKLMLARGISAVPVIGTHGQLVGMVSEGDLMRRGEIGTQKRRSWWLEHSRRQAHACGGVHQGARAQGTRRHDPSGRVGRRRRRRSSNIVELLEKHNIKRVPVVNDGRVVGIVSRANLLRAFASRAPKARPRRDDDSRSASGCSSISADSPGGATA